MINLDSLSELGKLDSLGILESLNNFPQQLEDSFRQAGNLEFVNDYKGLNNVVICGMGGSALGGRIVDSLMADRARLPIKIVTDFNIPHYVNDESLVIISSYSGNTQETISACFESLNRKAKVIIVAAGGKLEQIKLKENLDGYIFKPEVNTSNQPRMGLGYSIGALLAILSKLEVIYVTKDEVMEAADISKKMVMEYGERKSSQNNISKIFAEKLQNKAPILVASGHLVGACHAFKNQLNENSKNFAVLFDLPELNHHLMEGLKFPAKLRSMAIFVFFESDQYSLDVLTRYPVTKDVVEKNGYESLSFKLTSKSKLCQIFELLVFGGFVSFYLAALNGVDPGPIPWVDYFKEKLTR